MPLLKALVRHIKQKPIPFHMPGHKMGVGVAKRFGNLMKTDPFSLDLTELPGLDDLHNPTGPIREAQIRAAALFGAQETFFLINGTTVGIHASILAVCKSGDEIVLPRDVHRSVIGACILAGVWPRFLNARLDQDFFIAYPPTALEVAEALRKYPAAKAVFQIYPTYYGLVGDLTGVAKIAHSHSIPLIVDEAHGAHFILSEQLPPTAIESGADLSIQSTHKTLGAFTQASMLHLNGSLIDRNEVSRQLSLLQTTSPSYLLMASLDAATGHMETAGRALMDKVIRISKRTRAKIDRIPEVKCLGTELVDHGGVIAVDPTKLYISFKGLGITGYQVAETLVRKYKIQVELSDNFCILCMLSIGNCAGDAEALVDAIREIAVTNLQLKLDNMFTGIKNIPIPDLVMTPRDAWFSSKAPVPIKDAVGRVSAETIATYPPGIPIVCPGEVISAETVELIGMFKAEKPCFHGPADPNLNFITVVVDSKSST